MRLEFRGDPMAWSYPDDKDLGLGGGILLHGNPDDDYHRDPRFQLLTDAEVSRARRIAIRANVSFMMGAEWLQWWGHLAPDGSTPSVALHQRLVHRDTRYVTSRDGRRWLGPEWVRVLVRMEAEKHAAVQSWLRDAARRGHAPTPYLWFNLISDCISTTRELPTWAEFLSADYAESPMLCESAEIALCSRSAMPEPSDFFYAPVEKF